MSALFTGGLGFGQVYILFAVLLAHLVLVSRALSTLPMRRMPGTGWLGPTRTVLLRDGHLTTTGPTNHASSPVSLMTGIRGIFIMTCVTGICLTTAGESKPPE